MFLGLDTDRETDFLSVSCLIDANVMQTFLRSVCFHVFTYYAVIIVQSDVFVKQSFVSSCNDQNFIFLKNSGVMIS